MPDDYGLPSTHLSLLAAADSDDEEVRRRTLEEMIKLYRPGMCRYVAWRFRRSQVDPEDIVHKLLVDRIIGRTLLHCYLCGDRKGFRSYLKTALCNLVKDELRRERRYHPGDDLDGAASEKALDGMISTEQVRVILTEVIRQVRAYYIQRNQQRDWEAFFRLFVEPTMMAVNAPTYEEVQSDLGFEKKPYAIIANVKRRFELVLGRVLQKQLGTSDPDAIEDELRDIRRGLSFVDDLNIGRLMTEPVVKECVNTDLANLNASQLSSLFQLTVGRGTEFTDVELRAFYHMYLTVDVTSLFEQCHMKIPELLLEKSSEDDSTSMTIELLLQQPKPPLGVLIALKRLSRRIVTSDTSLIPKQIAFVFRFVCVGLALVRHNENISKMPRKDLSRGFRRALQYPWIDKQSRSLLEISLKQLETR